MRFHQAGFTLAELLIALAILGVIATFAVPKVLQSQQNNTRVAIAKETAATISEAYQIYKSQNGSPPATFKWNDLSRYLNYVRRDTTSDFDPTPGYGTVAWSCGNGVCYSLHNGALIYFDTDREFNGSDPLNNGLHFTVDPDGKYSGRGDSISFVLQYNGRLFVNGEAESTACSNIECYTAWPENIPDWFSWD